MNQFVIRRIANSKWVIYEINSNNQIERMAAGPFDDEETAQIECINLVAKQKTPKHNLNLHVIDLALDSELNKATYNKLRILVNGILTGQVNLETGTVAPKDQEVLISFESYLSKFDHLTPKQLKWCNTLLFKYKETIHELIKNPNPGIVPKAQAGPVQPAPVPDHRKYERVIDLDEPQKKSRRGRLIKEEE